MEKKLKYRSAHFYVPGKDPLTQQDIRVERTASYGQVLSSEDGVNTGDVVYGVPEDEIRRLEVLHPGIFFSAAELAAAAFSDLTTTSVVVGTQAAIPGAETPAVQVGAQNEVVVPLTFNEMQDWQIEEWIRSTQPTPEELLDAAMNEPSVGAQSALAIKFLAAENAVTGGEPREEVVQLFASNLGVGAQPPEGGSEGVKGTAPEPDPALIATQTEPGSVLEASDAAVAYADEHNLDLSRVHGSGTQGRITKPDVEAYHKQQQEGA